MTVKSVDLQFFKLYKFSWGKEYKLKCTNVLRIEWYFL